MAPFATLPPSSAPATPAADLVAPPIEAAEFAALMAGLGGFGADRRIVVAVSGGADSMALALLAARWGHPHAVIVDHGLRPEAAHEAELTRARLLRLDIPTQIVRAGLRPGPAAAARARAARYDLLLQACRDAACADLLLAHHAEDQAETVRMREDSGSAAAGLAGMPAIGYRADARLLRPLLTVPRDRLRATARAAGLAWVEDPTNHDSRTARARLRIEMTPNDIAAALARAVTAATRRVHLEHLVATDLRHVRFHPEGFAVVAAPLGPDALSATIWAVSGRAQPPPRAALESGLTARTTHGVLLQPAGRLGPGTLVTREPAGVAPAIPMQSGAFWDGRFRCIGAVAMSLPDHSLGALGDDAAAFRARSHLPAVVLRTLPAIRRGDCLVAVPHLGVFDWANGNELAIQWTPFRPAAGAPFR